MSRGVFAVIVTMEMGAGKSVFYIGQLVLSSEIREMWEKDKFILYTTYCKLTYAQKIGREVKISANNTKYICLRIRKSHVTSVRQTSSCFEILQLLFCNCSGLSQDNT